MLSKFKAFFKESNINVIALLLFAIYIVFVIKVIAFQQLGNNLFFGTYGILVSIYILSRFALSYFYTPHTEGFDATYQPTITFAVPSKNEEENIRETILKIAQSNYPKEKFNIIAINDGSTDGTLAEMKEAKKIVARQGVVVTVIDWKKNKGKREGMAECVKLSHNEIMVFIDSDSFVQIDTAKEIVKYFSDPSVGAVSGHTFVANAETNFLTKMQSVRYFVAFKAYKAAEALFGCVTCCPGCCSAYRTAYITPIIDQWLNQKFLGVKCTYGDDRSLTNFILRDGYKSIFSPSAIAYTVVPETLRIFMRQQLRWKKSWIRENVIASEFFWKKNPIMSLSFYLGVLLPFLAPIVVVRALFWHPLITGVLPLFYFAGLALMAFIYGLYYYLYTKNKYWLTGALLTTFYGLILIWQLPQAILTIRDSRWGTR